VKIALDPAMVNALPVEAAFRSAAEAGYSYVELGNRNDLIPAFTSVQASPSDLAAVRFAASKSGVQIVSVAVIQSWSSPDEDVRRQAVEWWKDGIASALAFGCTRVNTELSGDPKLPGRCRDAFLHSIETLLPFIEREGIEVVVEPHPGDFLETTADAVELLQAVGSERIRYLHCLPHTFYLGGTVADQVERAHGFDHVHVADTYRPGRTILNPPGSTSRIHQHFDIGRGELDWVAVHDALQSVAFDGILTVQVFGWEDQAERSFRLNLAALERLFGSESNGKGDR
jgi:myo-inositol catabolism protein IolH